MVGTGVWDHVSMLLELPYLPPSISANHFPIQCLTNLTATERLGLPRAHLPLIHLIYSHTPDPPPYEV